MLPRRVLILFGLAVTGCQALKAPPPLPPQEIIVRVSAGQNEPLRGVSVRPSVGAGGVTDERGVVKLRIDGEEGTKIDLAVACPAGFAAAAAVTRVTLRRADRAPLFDIPCKPYEHAVVIAFKSTGAAGIPISYLGSELTRTDAAGYALIELEPHAGDSLKFTFDTSDPKFKYLRPQNPEITVQAPDGDETFTLEQRFVEDKPKVVRIAKPAPRVPTELTPKQ